MTQRWTPADGGGQSFRGGCTIVCDLDTGEVRYVIRKRVGHIGRTTNEMKLPRRADRDDEPGRVFHLCGRPRRAVRDAASRRLTGGVDGEKEATAAARIAAQPNRPGRRRRLRRASRAAGKREAGDHPHVPAGRRRLLPGEFSARRPGRFPHPHRLRRASGTDGRQPEDQGHGSGSQESYRTARSTWWSERTSIRTTFRDFPRSRRCSATACAGEIWAAWTEDADDAFAKSLRTKKDKALTALYGAHTRMQLAGVDRAGAAARLAARLLRRRGRAPSSRPLAPP